MERFTESAETRGLSLVVVNREAPTPIQTMLEGLFDRQPITVDERRLDGEDADVVYLLDGDEVVATSPLVALQELILLVNSDLYITGTRGPHEVELPDVIAALEDVPFTLRGYPESNQEKLLLITISRYIERLALEHGGGTHRASFQRLSRINDERGTRSVYERLAESGVETHVYGVPDWIPPSEFDATVHGGRSRDYRDPWFVTFVPDAEGGRHGGLVALETDRRTWEGFWTFDPEDVTSIARYVEREL